MPSTRSIRMWLLMTAAFSLFAPVAWGGHITEIIDATGDGEGEMP